MFSIKNNTGYTFAVQLGSGVVGPDLIRPGDNPTYGVPVGDAPDMPIKAICEQIGSLSFAVGHGDGNIVLANNEEGIISRISWGGEFTISSSSYTVPMYILHASPPA